MMKKSKKHEEQTSSTPSHENDAATNNSNPTNEKSVESTESEPDDKKDSNAVSDVTVWQHKYEEMNDKYLRLYSEFDNFRKRVLKEKIELSKTASEQVLTDFLVILDDFERAIASFDKVESIEPLKEGTLLIYNKFRNSMEKKGLEEIKAMGEPFDTDYHEAIANIPASSNDQKNKVVDVTQKGYTLNGKVIRFAKVVVGN